MARSGSRARFSGLCCYASFSVDLQRSPSQCAEVHRVLGLMAKLRRACFYEKWLVAPWKVLTRAEGILSSSLYLFLIVSFILMAEPKSPSGICFAPGTGHKSSEWKGFTIYVISFCFSQRSSVCGRSTALQMGSFCSQLPWFSPDAS